MLRCCAPGYAALCCCGRWSGALGAHGSRTHKVGARLGDGAKVEPLGREGFAHIRVLGKPRLGGIHPGKQVRHPRVVPRTRTHGVDEPLEIRRHAEAVYGLVREDLDRLGVTKASFLGED